MDWVSCWGLSAETNTRKHSWLTFLSFSLSLFAGSIPRFSIAAAAANMAQYLSQNHHQNGQLKAHSGALVDRSHLYWPGLQGLVTNPMAWRDRLAGTSKLNTQNAASLCVCARARLHPHSPMPLHLQFIAVSNTPTTSEMNSITCYNIKAPNDEQNNPKRLINYRQLTGTINWIMLAHPTPSSCRVRHLFCVRGFYRLLFFA